MIMSNEQIYRGVMLFFSNSRGYGFIQWEKDGTPQRDLFCHWSDIKAPDGQYRTVKKGASVIFQIGVNNHGQPKAINLEEIKL
jgi:cold shock CspA family protein